MKTDVRRKTILRLLAQKSSVSVSELSAMFSLSEVSIRRLLVIMEKEGSIKRTWGGAVSMQSSLSEFSNDEKATKNLEQKQRIAQAAYDRIQDGEAVFLDSGTTTLGLARLIVRGDKRRLMVVTNALNIAMEFQKTEDIEVVLIGGQFRHRILCCTGFFAMEALKHLFFDKCFVTGNHFSAERGFTTPSLQEAEMKRKVIFASKESYVLMDASKYGDDSLSLIIPCEDANYLITDWRLQERDAMLLGERGLQVIIAQPQAY